MKPSFFGILFGLSTVSAVLAGTPAPFTPLPNNAGSSTDEATAPFLLPPGFTQTLITDRDTLSADPDFAATFGNWDMVALDSSSRFVFIPFEVGAGAGLGRYDRETGDFVKALEGNNAGTRSTDPSTWDPAQDDFARLDPAIWTPNGTVLTGEETSGGRLFEWTNPLMAAGDAPVVRWLSSVASVGHEGVKFDAAGNLYVVDENNSGSVYKFVPNDPTDLGKGGQNFVLSVNAFDGDASADWDAASIRIGAATWVAINNADGSSIEGIRDPLDFGSTGGRGAADDANGTPYGRPEDMDITTLANGHEVLFFTATSEHSVYSIELVDPVDAVVRLFASRNTLNEAFGTPVGSELSSPDNLAVGPNGEVYIIEDQTAGDIWAATDADNDGIAESMGRIASLGIPGTEEPTGWILDRNDADTFLVCVQHPSSGNDALWAITAPWDHDGDNVIDPNDVCPNSNLSETVIVNGLIDSGVWNVLYDDGCTLGDLVNGLAEVALNHGLFVKSVGVLGNDLLSPEEAAALKNAAARAQ